MARDTRHQTDRKYEEKYEEVLQGILTNLSEMRRNTQRGPLDPRLAAVALLEAWLTLVTAILSTAPAASNGRERWEAHIQDFARRLLVAASAELEHRIEHPSEWQRAVSEACHKLHGALSIGPSRPQ